MADELDRARKMLLLPRAEWCVKELRRSARMIRDAAGESQEMIEAANGTALMADTMEELRAEAGRAARASDWLARSGRYLLDMLQMENEAVEAMYGRTDTLEQAAVELRRAIASWESPDA